MTSATSSALRATARAMVESPKVILAADESTGTMGDRLSSIGVENTLEARTAFRRLLFSASGIERYVGATILFEETLGDPELVELLTSKGIIPVVKIDKGLADYGAKGEKIVRALSCTPDRARARPNSAVFSVSLTTLISCRLVSASHSTLSPRHSLPD